jgi:hypothetical protein
MWEPPYLTTVWAFMACYRDSFTFTLHDNISQKIELFMAGVFYPQLSVCVCRCRWYHSHCQRRVRRQAATRAQSSSRYSSSLGRSVPILLHVLTALLQLPLSSLKPNTVNSHYLVPKHPEFSCNQQRFQGKIYCFYIKLLRKWSCCAHMFTYRLVLLPATTSNALALS